MKKFVFSICLVITFSISVNFYNPNTGPIISNLTYNNITQSGLTVSRTTDVAADTSIRLMVTDSNKMQAGDFISAKKLILLK
ncbi:MAG: hypothetical protein NTY74_16075 [Ignavibacteriae bacterium]|nr:hypothetical protein [Ignavibacteriota bacterium]